MKEFDIYLRNRLTQCDIIVNSMPFREGTTVFHRLVLDCCLQGLLSYEQLAIENQSVLASEISAMIKAVLTRIDACVCLGSELSLAEDKLLGELRDGLALDTVLDKLNEIKSTQVDGDIALSSSLLAMSSEKQIGRLSSGLVLSSSLRGILKLCMMRIADGVKLGTSVGETAIQKMTFVGNCVSLNSDLVDLLYQAYIDGELVNGTALDSVVENIELTVVVPLIESGLVLGSAVEGTLAQVESGSESGLVLGAEADPTALVSAGAMESTISLASFLSIAMTALRKISEMDDLYVSDFDGMSISDVDYITLDDDVQAQLEKVGVKF